MSIVAVIAYFAILLIIIRLNSSRLQRGIKSKSLFLFRAFFPSWRFFEDFEYFPVLHFRIGLSADQIQQSSWTQCLKKSNRNWSRFFFNPDGNFSLACCSLLQQLLADLDETDVNRTQELESQVSYQVTKNLVLFQILQSGSIQKPFQYQFKITASTDDDILISPIYEA